jgi:hypothetical protein
VIGVIGVVAVVAAAAIVASSRPQFVVSGGAPAYEYNEPFLDWPQTGDLPCEDEFGPCATPSTPRQPAAPGSGRPLELELVRVPVGSRGHHEFELGELVFPVRGHTRTWFRIANADTGQFRVIAPRVEFRSLEPGAPPFTEFARDRPPVKGPERVRAILVWDVDWAAEGAAMEIADLVVR